MSEAGIHELTAGYALHALDPDERRAYEQHLPGCERCREQLASLGAVTDALAAAVAGPTPGPGLRERILADAREEPQNVVPLHRHRTRPQRALAATTAVAALLAIAFGTWAAVLHSRLDHARNDLAGQRASLAVISNPNARQITLQTGRGKLIVAPDGSDVLIVNRITPAPPHKTYEIWVIPKTHRKTPIPAGLFPGGNQSIVALSQHVRPGDIVAVTLEHTGGVSTPTTQPIIVTRPV
jgi:anti-sigma-K factor RskA